MEDRRTRTQKLAITGVIGATYAAVTIIAMQALNMLAWGPVQLRVSEALAILPLFFAEAVPGLAIGCLLANLLNLAMSGTGATGLLDVVFGTLATLVGALWTQRFRQRPGLALAGPVVTNALIVAAYLPIILKKGLGYYTIPLTSIALDGRGYLVLFAFGIVSVGIGEAIVVYGLGLPLATLLRKALKS